LPLLSRFGGVSLPGGVALSLAVVTYFSVQLLLFVRAWAGVSRGLAR